MKKHWGLVYVLISLVVVGSLVNYISNLQASLQKLENSYQQLNENIARAQSRKVEKIDLSDISTEIKADLRQKPNAKVTVSINQHHSSQTKKSTHKKYGGVIKELYWTNKSGQKLPIGVAAYRLEKDEWLARTYDLNFEIKIVESETYEGSRQAHVEAWASVPHRKGYEGVAYRLPISSASIEYVPPKNKIWSWWNPTLSLGFDHNLDPLIKINAINYGMRKSLPSWEFFSPVFDFQSKRIGVELFSYNIAEQLPLVKNIHAGIGVYSNKKPFLYMAVVF